MPLSCSSFRSLWHRAVLSTALVLCGCAGLPARSPEPPVHAIPATTATELGAMTRHFPSTVRDGASGVRALPQAAFALDARLQLIRHAQVSLDLQYYLLGNDKTGRLILRELRDAAKRGVRVRLLLDDFYTAGLDPLLLGLAAYPNVEVRLFNPFASGRENMATRWISFASEFHRLNHRMHNKLFIADGAVAIAGGRNLADEYFLRSTGANFIDLDLMLAGPVVPELANIFDVYWNSEVVYPIQRVATRTDTPEELRARFDGLTSPAQAPAPPALVDGDLFGDPPIAASFKKGAFDLVSAVASAAADDPLKATGQASADAVAGGRAASPSLAERTYALFDTARSDVAIVSPYFIPGEEGIDHIRRLRARGVQVSVVTNSLADTDEPLVNVSYNSFRVALLKLGVELFEVSSQQIKRSLNLRKAFAQARGRLHAKLALIDREWVLIGSMNFDPRSAKLNTELGVRVKSFELGYQLIGAFQIDNAEGVYRLRLKPGTDDVQWVSTDGDGTVLDDEPEASLLVRIKLMMFSWFVPTDLL